MNASTGKIVMIIGAGILLIGVVIYFFGDKFTWLGNLPGDIRIEKQNLKIYIPITSMILISIVITLIMRILRKFL